MYCKLGKRYTVRMKDDYGRYRQWCGFCRVYHKTIEEKEKEAKKLKISYTKEKR